MIFAINDNLKPRALIQTIPVRGIDGIELKLIRLP